jgi:hypothetical protein
VYPRNTADAPPYEDVKVWSIHHIPREVVMKGNKHGIVAAFCLVAGGMLCTAPAFAGQNDDYIWSLPQEKIDLIEQNIVNALQSDIPGMQADAAQLVRDLRDLRPEQSFPGCVIPLMAIVKNEDADTGARILAALALNQLDSPMGHFTISRMASFTSEPRLKHVCSWLAYERKTGRRPDEKGIASFEPIEEGEE